jgi:hypothetical protein
METVYLGHDNTIDLYMDAESLEDEDDFSSVTKITASFGDLLISSEDPASGPIKWDQDGYQNREIRLDLGHQSIPEGTYDVPIVVYDASIPEGVMWGIVEINVIQL